MTQDTALVQIGGDAEQYDHVIKTEGFGPQTTKMFDFLRDRVISQDRAIQKVAAGFAIHNAGLSDGRQPIATLVLSGPTGVGKTYLAEVIARYLICDEIFPPLVRIQCSEYGESHQVATLIGSPVGYVRSDEPGLLSQFNIDEHDFWHKVRPILLRENNGALPDAKKLTEMRPELHRRYGPFTSVILFDEFEKADKRLHNFLLHIIDEGELGMNDRSTTRFNNSVIVLTCNVGGKEQQDILSGRGGAIGFRSEQQVVETDQLIYQKTMELIRNTFNAEFVGRVKDGIVVFRSLDRDSCRRILENMLQDVQSRVLRRADAGGIPVVLHFTDGFRENLLDRADVRSYGARELRALVKKQVTLRLATALESGELRECDEVLFTVDRSKEIVMQRKRRPEPVKYAASVPLVVADMPVESTAIIPLPEDGVDVPIDDP